MDWKYALRRGLSKDFREDSLIPGEVAEITDKNTLAFCFSRNNIAYLELDKKVDRETALEFIFRIRQFVENSYDVATKRLESGRINEIPDNID